jgi:hypothetical protein
MTTEEPIDQNTTTPENQPTPQGTMSPKYNDGRPQSLDEDYDIRDVEQDDSEPWPEVFADIDMEETPIEEVDTQKDGVRFQRPRFIANEALELRDVLTRNHVAFLDEAEIVEEITENGDPMVDEKLVKQSE